MQNQDEQTTKLQDTIHLMHVDIAVMAASIKTIESDGCETRAAITEINRTLLAGFR